MNPATIEKAVEQFIKIANQWSEWANNRQLFAQIWSDSETPDWTDRSQMYNHFYTKMNRECGGNGYLFLISLDNSNLRRASVAVSPGANITDIVLAKNFALYFNMRSAGYDFISKYQALNEATKYEIIQNYIDQGYHLYL